MTVDQNVPREIEMLIQRSIDAGDHARYLIEQLREAGYELVEVASRRQLPVPPAIVRAGDL